MSGVQDFVGAAARLGPGDIIAEAAATGCRPAAIRMFLDVEAGASGYLPAPMPPAPKILFEAHYFHRKTAGRFDQDYPDLSSPVWDAALYGAGGAHQYDRLCQAMALDHDAALASASWGLGQVIGDNFAMAGFDSLDDFVAAMMASERHQLEAMLGYLHAASLVPCLRNDPPDFTALARGYNGPGQVEHYAAALAGAWGKECRAETGPGKAVPAAVSRASHPDVWHEPLPPLDESRTVRPGYTGVAVMALQRRLAADGASLCADGVFGPMTFAALVAYQKARGLQADGIAGPATLHALNAPAAPPDAANATAS